MLRQPPSRVGVKYLCKVPGNNRGPNNNDYEQWKKYLQARLPMAHPGLGLGN